MKRCVIIGSGYVGTSLAYHWFKRGYSVTATTRSAKKLKILNQFVQKSVLITKPDPNEIFLLAQNNDLIALTISPETLYNYKDLFLRSAQALKQIAQVMELPKTLIFASHSMVYGEHNGLWVDETSPCYPITEQAEILIETEKILLSLQELDWKVCILRLGDVYGPGHELSSQVKELLHHVMPGNGSHFTNMIHQQDVIGAVDYVHEHALEGIFNLADDDHPSRKELYHQICERHHYPALQWNASHPRIHNGNKRTSNHKIKAAGFSLSYPHRILD